MADETQVQGQETATAEVSKGPKVVQLTISALLEDLKNGVSRADMAAKYGVTKAAIAEAFKNPKLKGHRVIREGARKKGTGKKFQIDLVDDVADEVVESTESVKQTQEGTQASAPETVNQPEVQAPAEQEVTNTPAPTEQANW